MNIKKIIIAAAALLMLTGMTACGKKPITVCFLEAETVEIVSYDEGIDSIEAVDNKFTAKISKNGTYNVEVKIDETDASVSIKKDKSGFIVESNADYSVAVISE